MDTWTVWNVSIVIHDYHRTLIYRTFKICYCTVHIDVVFVYRVVMEDWARGGSFGGAHCKAR